MSGVTDDHEFKTRNGWKRLDEIDIETEKSFGYRQVESSNFENNVKLNL